MSARRSKPALPVRRSVASSTVAPPSIWSSNSTRGAALTSSESRICRLTRRAACQCQFVSWPRSGAKKGQT